MAFTISTLLQPLSLPRTPNARPSKPVPLLRTAAVLSSRRQLLLLLTATTAVTARAPPSLAEDIPLFGLRKKLKKVEEEAEVIVKEGFEAAEKGLEVAEKGLQTAEIGIKKAEKGIETAEREIETAVSFGGLGQAAVVAGAEFGGVLIATSIVNGILGPEAQKS